MLHGSSALYSTVDFLREIEGYQERHRDPISQRMS